MTPVFGRTPSPSRVARGVVPGPVATVLLAVAALLAVALLTVSLSGCTKIGTAGVSTTVGCDVMTTDPSAIGATSTTTIPGAAAPGATGATPPGTAAPDAAAQRQRLEQANELAIAHLTGITLFGAPWVDQCINESQLIVHGTVVGVDDPRTGDGSFSNPYTVFYVEPEVVLKGASRLGTPVAFALLLPGDGGESRPWVAEGDEVLVCSQLADEELVTGSAAAGAYLPWNDSYGVFLPVGDRFANVLVPSVTTTLDEVRRLVGPGDTSTTLGPGQMSFGSVNAMFEILLEWKGLPGTLPYRALSAGEIAWLAEAEPEITVREAKGYELAGGDLAILFYYEPTLQSDEEMLAAEERLTSLAKRAYPDSSDIARANLPYIDNYGYVLISDDTEGELRSLLQRARTGPVPPEG